MYEDRNAMKIDCWFLFLCSAFDSGMLRFVGAEIGDNFAYCTT